ncbi:TPA: hypothetical protein DIC38_03300 [Candidatus Nomurabacteria bacterium]|nr:MAG: hypothetical protein O210_OD1C00001G0124 [Parcubacteria bacterium RAAC4_OD1_1]HCY26678.1 hypothetical protein [Candidatus Nomurabacteria bacterium]
MDQEIKNLLEENLRLSKENNELLIKVRNFQRWSQISKALYWLVIIGVALGAFYFIKPYFDNVLNIYTGGVSDINMIKDLGGKVDINSINELLKQY